MVSILLLILMNFASLAALLAGYALLPLLVMAVFRPARPLAGRGITAISWVAGLAGWTIAAIAIRTGYGTRQLLLGLGLTAAAALGAAAAGLPTWGLLASLLPMFVLLLVHQRGFTERQLFIWTLWLVAILPLHFLGKWISAEVETRIELGLLDG
jgi:hypothetical protein